MTGKIHPQHETFESYRDRKNGDSEKTAFFRSLGLIAPREDGVKVKTVREQVSEKVSDVFKVVEQSIASAFDLAGVPTQEREQQTLRLRELLMKELTPYLRKDKAENSMMDLSTLGLTDESKIRGFLHRHGINLDKPVELEYALRVFREAVNFYDTEIASPDQGNAPKRPVINHKLRKFNDASDIYSLFKTSAGHGIRHLTPQACALLRIALVIDYMEKDPHISSLDKVQDEVKSVLFRHVRKVGNSLLYHSGSQNEKPIPLILAVARKKERIRVIMKLLHKPSNSTSEVLDHIGARFETESASDALRLIYQMFFDNSSAVLPSMYIRFGKTKQSLIDSHVLMDALKDSKRAEQLFAELSEITRNHQDVQSESLTGTENGHSSSMYRAIHITVDFPVMVNGNLMFFPIEIQYVDKNAHNVNNAMASHESYVDGQRKTATARILDNNLHSNYQRKKHNGKHPHGNGPARITGGKK